MDSIDSRRSIRKYRTDDIPEDIVFQLIEAGLKAPSGNNTQPWHFITVTDDDIKKKIISVSHNQKWMQSAPVFIVCVADLKSRLADTTGIVLDENTDLPELKLIIRDTAIAVEHIVLEATNRGLGTCWEAWFNQKEIRPILHIPDDKYVVCVLTVGYPAEHPGPRKRKEMQEVLHRNYW